MEYCVELLENAMLIREKEGDQEVAYINVVDRGAHFSFAKTHITAAIQSGGLRRFFADLPANLRAVKDKARGYERSKRGRRSVRWNVGGLKFHFDAGARIRKVIKEFAKLSRDIEPLLELAEIIIKQLERRPLNVTTSMKLFMPVPVIDEMPVKQWLEVRERAALDIDPGTAEVVCAYKKYFDPYDVYPELPGQYGDRTKELYARSPGSNVWVWFNDLPKGIQRALEKRIDQEQLRQREKEKVEVIDLSKLDLSKP